MLADTQKKSRPLGENAIWLEDYNKLSEVIVSTIQLNEGVDRNDVLKSWDGTTNLIVTKALDGINANVVTLPSNSHRGVKRI